MTTTPFFPAWRQRLAPLGQRVRHLRTQSLMHLDLLFGSLLPSWLLAQTDEGPNSREQIYSVRRTFFGFLYQVLNPDCSCREVVRQIQSLFALLSSRRVSEDTGAYCVARARLPLDSLARLRCAVATHAGKAEQLWRGFRVKVVDGTAVSMPDTRKNQRAYPQSAEQKPGCGFPFMKIVGVFSLSTGVLLHYARGNKHQHELSLLHRLVDVFKSGDLVLADRGFNCYTLLALLWRKNVPALMRLPPRAQWRFASRQTAGQRGPTNRLAQAAKLGTPVYTTEPVAVLSAGAVGADFALPAAVCGFPDPFCDFGHHAPGSKTLSG